MKIISNNLLVKILVIILVSVNIVYSQNNCNSYYNDDLKFKEIYDFLSTHKFPNSQPPTAPQLINALTYPPNNYIYPNDADEAEEQFSNLDNVGPLLESLIRMYEITHDNAYLIKAINKSNQFMNARGGATAPSPYAWVSGFNF